MNPCGEAGTCIAHFPAGGRLDGFKAEVTDRVHWSSNYHKKRSRMVTFIVCEIIVHLCWFQLCVQLKVYFVKVVFSLKTYSEASTCTAHFPAGGRLDGFKVKIQIEYIVSLFIWREVEWLPYENKSVWNNCAVVLILVVCSIDSVLC